MPGDSAKRPARKATSGSRVEQSATARDFARAIEEDIGFQVRSWRVQRAGWALWILIILVGLAGLLGGGPLSRAEARSADGRLTIEYDRFARHGAPTELRMRVDPALVSGDRAVLWLTRPFLDGLELNGMVPEPSRALDAEGRTGYEFEVAGAGSEGLDVTFLIRYDEPFLRETDVAVNDAASAHLNLFVYP